MRTASRLLIASIASLSFSGLALAQDAPAGDAPAGGDATAPAPDPAAAPAATPTPDAGAAADMGMWPRSNIDRPLTLPKGLLQVAGDLSTSTSNFFDPATIRLGVGYGITPELELNVVGYTFTTKDAGKGSVDANLGYAVVKGGAGGKLDLTVRAQVGYNLAGGTDGDGGLNPIGLGVHVRYKVTPKISIVSGNPGQIGSITAPLPTGGVFNLGTISPQLSIGVTDPKFSLLSLPVGVGFQATPELYIQADTSLATFELSAPDGFSTTNLFIFDKLTPLSFTALYNAMPALDLYANLTIGNITPPDGENVGDTMSVGVGARYYIGDAVKPGAAPAAAM